MFALDGLRVLDMSTAIAGPYCAQILADLGADVIKVEHPGRSFIERLSLCPPEWHGPPFSPFWLSSNRNKRSVTLNLKRQEGKEVLADLAKVSDVVVENFGADTRPQLVDESWGWEINPRLVWASMSFCGRTGPDSNLDGYDLLAQARSGLLSITGYPDERPVKAGNSSADYLAGSHLAVGILAALVQRAITGKGQLVDTSLVESALACTDGFPMWYSVAGIVPQRAGNYHLSGNVGYASLECTDGELAITANANRLTYLVEHVLEMPELLPVPLPDDPDFRPKMKKLGRAMEDWSRSRSVEEMSTMLTQAGVPHSRVQTLAEIWDDPQLQARDMFVDLEFGDIGRVRTIGSPLHLSDSPVEVRRNPPAAGQDNEEVLTGLLGYDAEHFANLVEAGAIWEWSPSG